MTTTKVVKVTAIKPVRCKVVNGRLVPQSLVEWAEKFNADHRLASPKAVSK